MSEKTRPSLYSDTRSELESLLADWGFKTVHAAKVWRHLYLAGRSDWDTIHELPQPLAQRLDTEMSVGELPITRETHSSDGFTRKYLLGLHDGHQIETVLMRYHRGNCSAGSPRGRNVARNSPGSARAGGVRP